MKTNRKLNAATLLITLAMAIVSSMRAADDNPKNYMDDKETFGRIIAPAVWILGDTRDPESKLARLQFNENHTIDVLATHGLKGEAAKFANAVRWKYEFTTDEDGKGSGSLSFWDKAGKKLTSRGTCYKTDTGYIIRHSPYAHMLGLGPEETSYVLLRQ